MPTAGKPDSTCRGIALGDSWISALDYVKTWGEFLKAWSLLDDYQLSQLAPLQLDIQVRLQGDLSRSLQHTHSIDERSWSLKKNVQLKHKALSSFA